MDQSKNEFNAFKEHQKEPNQNLIQRLNSLEVKNQNSIRRFYENSQQFATVVQIKNLVDKLTSFDDRIKRLEDLDPINNQVRFFSIYIKTKNITTNSKIPFKVSSNSRLKLIKKISEKFAFSTTVYGLNRVIKAENRLIKVVWGLMALVSVSFGLFVIANTVITFLKYDVFTQTKRIVASSLLMPSVTFCFKNPETKDLDSIFDKAEFITSNRTNLTGEHIFVEILENWDDSGHCIKFNHFTDKNGTQSFAAYSSEDYFIFEIDLNVKFERLRFFLSDNYNNVIDWSQYLTTSFNVSGYYSIAFKKEVEIKLEEPYNQCKNVSDITYRQADCLVQCKNKNFANNYNCTLKNFYSVSGYGFCKKAYFGSSEFELDCLKQCPKECATTKFDLLLTNTDLGPNSTDKLLFHIWFLHLYYIEIRQNPKMSGFSLLNEIGGALGLFVGITFLSIFELLEYLFEILLVFYK